MNNKALFKLVLVAAASILALVGVWIQLRNEHQAKPAPKMVYDPHGYGGFVPAPAPARHGSNMASGPGFETLNDPIVDAANAYNAGHYYQSDTIAKSVLKYSATAHGLPSRRAAAEAQQILAYSASRRHDLKLAREHFALMRQSASALPGGGAQAADFGGPSPTLQQEAVFQHAVCTSALGDKAAAEVEYRTFMEQYPESPLINAAMLRIEHMHGGNLPADDRAVWQRAKKISLMEIQKHAREAAMCGPECLAELLRRKGVATNAGKLADEMGTTGEGTTLAALAVAVKRRGWQPQGLRLTQQGLAEQRLPVIALLAQGHYVIVDSVTSAQVTLWDPDANGTGRGAQKTAGIASWQQVWQGVVLALSPSPVDHAVIAEIGRTAPKGA